MLSRLITNEYNNRIQKVFDIEKLVKNSGKIPEKKLHIVYVLTAIGISGGVKIILQHVNEIIQVGHRVTLVCHYPKPTWYPIKAEYIQVPFQIELAQGIPECDVIVATYWNHIGTCIDMGIAPVVYFEQGDTHLFDSSKLNTTKFEFIKRQLTLPTNIYTVSNQAKRYLNDIYGRNAEVFHNAINSKIFNTSIEPYKHDKPYFLMLGNNKLKFKGLEDIMSAYIDVKKEYPNIDLLWITPNTPTNNELQDIVTKYFINPPQELISNLYKGAIGYISGSHYESFSLPPLEAMAVGCPVVSTKNNGVMEYAVDNRNSLLAGIGSIEEISSKMKLIINDSKIRNSLIEGGLEAAKQFNWNIIIPEILDYYGEISTYDIDLSNIENEWIIHISNDKFKCEEDYIKLKKI